MVYNSGVEDCIDECEDRAVYWGIRSGNAMVVFFHELSQAAQKRADELWLEEKRISKPSA